MSVSQKQERIDREAKLLGQRLRCPVDYDKEDLEWIHIHSIPLPKGFNKPSTALLMIIPPNFPFTPPTECYFDRDLKASNGRELNHFFSSGKYDGKGWRHVCIHIMTWNPQYDTLYELVEIFRSTIFKMLS